MNRGPSGIDRLRGAGRAVMLSVLFVFGACDTAPGPEKPGLRPPVVSDLAYEPGAVLVNALPPESVVGGTATIPVRAEVRATDSDGDLERVSYVVNGPVAGADPLASGDLTFRGGGRYELDTEIGFPTAVTGRYTLLIFATDRSGRLGNDVRGAIDLLSEGNPPEIISIDMPASVRRPATGEPPVPVVIVVTADDPDGLANVLRVETVVNDATRLDLCDDGGAGSCNTGFGSSGDETAGDGRFTLTLQVESTNSLGSNSFEFVAVDRSGLRSEPVVRQIVIEQ